MTLDDTKFGVFTPSERNLVLQAAADVCAEKGFADTTVADVVERSGVPEERFDEMFGGDIEECLLAALNVIIGEVMSVVASSYSPDRSEWDSGLLGIMAILELMAANPSYAYLAFIVSRQMSPPRLQQGYLGASSLLAAMVDRLREQAVDGEQPSHLARGALGGAETTARAHILAGRTEDLPRLLPDLAYGATVGFLGQEEALRFAARGRELLRGTAWE